MITIPTLRFYYATNITQIFQMDNIDIKRGECIVLCGKSGSGKSTFLRLLNGLIPEYYEGEVNGTAKLAELDITQVGVEELSQYVGSVFQNPATQFFHEYVEDELVFPCENQGIPVDIIACRLDKVVEQFELEHYRQKSLYHLSGGQRQRVAIATALMQQPQIIVMDEPTANLDKQGVAIVQSMIRQLKDAGITIIIAEQRLAYLDELADKYFYFADGKLVEQWSSEQFQKVSNEYLHQIGLRARQLATVERMIQHYKQQFNDYQQQNLPSLIVENLVLHYGSVPIKTIPYLKLPLGKIIGITGKNGIGKTTFVKNLVGLYQSDGVYYWHDQKQKPKERLKQSAIVLQDVRMQLFSDSVKKELELGADKELLKRDKQLICDELGLTKLLDKHPMTLSGGQMQRVMIANALLSNKKLFVFDEITSGLCYENMQRVADLIKKLKRDDTLVLLVSHDEEFLAETVDCIFDLESV